MDACSRLIVAVLLCGSIVPSVLYSQEKDIVEDSGFQLIDADSRLRMLSAPNTGICAVNRCKEMYFITDVYGSTAIRRTYDKLLRLVKKEVWDIGASAENAAAIDIATYRYRDDKPILVSSEKQMLKDGMVNETVYDRYGRPESRRLFRLTKTKNGEMQKTVTSVISWIYDEQGRITERETSSFGTNSMIKKDTYDYTGTGIQPDHTYYENGVIRMRTVYTDRVNYTETMYFDRGYSVETMYEHGVRVHDRFMINGRVVPRNKYEQKK